jgi:hypothetical protein
MKTVLCFEGEEHELKPPSVNDAPPPLNGTRRLCDKRKTIEERFIEFDEKNPHVFEKLREFALQMKRSRGVKHTGRARSKYSMKALWERLRWHVMFEMECRGEWKLNNNFTALFARKLMEEEPELEGFFETRKRRTL